MIVNKAKEARRLRAADMFLFISHICGFHLPLIMWYEDLLVRGLGRLYDRPRKSESRVCNTQHRVRCHHFLSQELGFNWLTGALMSKR